MALSVIINAYDNQKMTVEHVKSCMKSSRVPDEIIIVNDGGDDILRDMLKEIPDRTCNIIYALVLQDIKWNQCGARNLGFWLSRGDYVSIEDNDHFPCYNYYEKSLELLKTYNRIVCKTRHVISMEDMLKGNFQSVHSRGSTDLTCIVTRELFSKLKGYDEKFCGYYGWEAPDWRNRLNRVEAKTICSGEMYVIIDGGVKIIERRFDGKNFRMDRENYQHLRRNNRALRKQSEIGILNFNYEVEYILR